MASLFSRIQLRSRCFLDHPAGCKTAGYFSLARLARPTELRRHHRPRRFRLRRLSPHRRHRQVLARHGIRSQVRRQGRTGPWHLQRLSDFVRVRIASRSADAQRRTEICLQAGACKSRKQRNPVYQFCRKGEVLTIPIGHMEGNYFCDDATLAELKRDDRIVFRYSNPAGEITPEANPNGSLENIAGICSPDATCSA